MSICVSNPEEIAAELKLIAMNRKEDGSTVRKIAEVMGLSQRTVYDYLDNRLKVNLKFIQACLIATNGDHDVKRFLCPDGWDLVPTNHSPVVGDIEKECGDVHIAVSELLITIRAAKADGKITPMERSRIERAIDAVRREINDVDVVIENDSRVVKLSK